MALNLSVTQSSGVVVTYWRVCKMHIDAVKQTITAEIGGWIDQPTYAGGGAPVAVLTEIMTSEQYTALLASPNLIAEFYELLSQMPDFTGATVVS